MSFDVLPPRLRNPKRETWFPEIQKENKGLLGRSTPLAKCYRGIGDAAGSTSKISVQRVALSLKSRRCGNVWPTNSVGTVPDIGEFHRRT